MVMIGKCRPSDRDPKRTAADQRWCVYNSDRTRVLGRYPTKSGAQKRLKQVEMFKHMRQGETRLVSILSASKKPKTKELMADQKSEVRVVCSADAAESLKNLLEYIRVLSSPGHSFSIVVDPDDRKNKKSFGADGDGSFSISSITVSDILSHKVAGQDELVRKSDEKVAQAGIVLAWTKPGEAVANFFLLRSPERVQKALKKAGARVQEAKRDMNQRKKQGDHDGAHESLAQLKKAQLEAEWYTHALQMSQKWEQLKDSEDKEKKTQLKENFSKQYKRFKAAVDALRDEFLMRDL